MDQLEYSRIIGSLMYVMYCTRPDIAFAVGTLSKYTSNPGKEHWNALLRILKHLKGTMDYGLHYGKFPAVIEGYSNATWNSDREDSLSVTAWIFTLGGTTISWKSKRQTCITYSSMESEFITLSSAGEEAEWLKSILEDIPIWNKPIPPLTIYCDK
ncbi:secreted RxLR effector protein 161-like [Cornus florida]|uniref:secreted RxLR effector protein 161-like n=1 Tax=Cornus florida TaxID=4283 RepID=UPI00289F0E85|nr:secreted RxLR effector protein 161-like [Cornus florida]